MEAHKVHAVATSGRAGGTGSVTALRFNHVGIGVADVDAAVDWYRRVFGLELVLGPFEVRADTGPGGQQAQDVLGPSFRHMRMAHMATDDGVGIELFQLLAPPHERREQPLEFWKSGTFHLCLTAEDLEGVTRRAVDSGGRATPPVPAPRRPDPARRMVSLEDPWGTIIELYSHDYRTMYG